MKRVVFFLLIVPVLLAACSPAQSGVQGTPGTHVPPTADVSLMTPVVGSATVIEMQSGQPLELRSKPEMMGLLVAVVNSGDAGQALGLDATGKWVLVKIKDKTGWAPVDSLYLVIAQ